MSDKKTRRKTWSWKRLTCKFKTSDSPVSETKTSESYMTKINGKKINLFDTPGVFDTDPNSSEFSPEILKCVNDCSKGVHAFLLVLKVERYTQHEQAVVNLILKYFSEEALKYTIVVFTHGNELEDGRTITEWTSESKALKGLIEKCGGRCHVFDNKHWKKGLRNPNKKQTKELFKTIDMMVEKNGDCYKKDIFTEQEPCPTEGWFQTCYKWIVQESIPVGVILAVFLGTVQLVKSGGAWVLVTQVAQGAKEGGNALVKPLKWFSNQCASPTEAVKEATIFMRELEDLFQQVKKTSAVTGTDLKSSSCSVQ